MKIRTTLVRASAAGVWFTPPAAWPPSCHVCGAVLSDCRCGVVRPGCAELLEGRLNALGDRVDRRLQVADRVVECDCAGARLVQLSRRSMSSDWPYRRSSNPASPSSCWLRRRHCPRQQRRQRCQRCPAIAMTTTERNTDLRCDFGSGVVDARSPASAAAPSVGEVGCPVVEDVSGVEDVVFREESPFGEVPVVSAYAIPGALAMAAPTPRVTASAPTRPICLA